MDKKKYYVTTPIYYASGDLHVGHCFCTVITDACARFKRLQGYDVMFLTGSDEHGMKIARSAKNAGLSPKEFVDKTVANFKFIWNKLGISYDKFIRTTDESHKKTVQKIMQRLFDQGDIYLGKYEGLYCTPCESFFTESQLVDGKCPDCGREVSKAEEEAYFLKLDKYSKKLEEYIETHPEFIEPVSRKNEIVNNFIKPGLQDLCVSRTSFKWGVPVTFDDKHVIYVWIDALSNYITFLGYDLETQSEEFKKYWPADVHLIGKDILRFHTIYWPIMLMALDLPLPKKIFGHPWLLSGEDKMSKSKGNIVYADDLVNLFGVDAVRYYLLHEMPFAQDGTFTYELLIERINSDLANILGNLVNRTISMANKYFDGKVTNTKVNEEVDNDLFETINNAYIKTNDKMNGLKVADAIDEVFEIFRRANKYIDETTPWTLAKDENSKERLETVIYNLLEAIREGSILLEPFLPNTKEEIFRQLNTTLTNKDDVVNEYSVITPSPIFARIDKEAKLKEIYEKM